jgi:hypothetical protein
MQLGGTGKLTVYGRFIKKQGETKAVEERKAGSKTVVV